MKIDRRTMLAGTAAAAGIVVANPSFAQMLRNRTSLFIYDARFDVSRQAAKQMAAQNIPFLDPRDRDLGVAWREDIPAMLADPNAIIAGMTLWSDQFVCESFGRDHGLSLSIGDTPSGPSGRDIGLQAWVLS